MIRPVTINGFTVFVRVPTPPNSAEYVIRDDATGIEKSTRIGEAQGGYYEVTSDGRYISIIADVTQGKPNQEDLVLASFDTTVTKNFIAFPVPQANLFHLVSNPANPNWLWIRNGGSQPNTYPGDPGGGIGPYRFASPTEVEWVTGEINNLQLTIKYILWRRVFNPATGEMQPIQQIDTWVTDPASPSQPTWYG